MRIVIVDDDRLVAVSLQTILEADERIQVLDTGYDGREAIRLYQKWKPDVLLMDIRMDTMSGLEAAEEILKQDRRQRFYFSPPFLMMNI